MGLGDVAKAQVVVDPRCRLPYYTYVLRGFAATECEVRFRRLDCPLPDGMAMLIDGARVWIDTNDFARVPEGPGAWADVVAKVNVEPDAEEVVPMGPLFGVRLWDLPFGYLKTVPLVAGGAPPVKTVQYLRFQGLTRLPIEVYQPGESDDSYVFHRSRRWTSEPEVNDRRLRFRQAVDRLGLSGEVSVADERIDLATYLRCTQRSVAVFNSPGLHACLGWKLGEFLALGKAIISLPVRSRLPAPLVHGHHVHFVDDDVEAIADALRLIVGNHDYRRHLESGARQWYEDHMAPAVVGERLIASAREYT